MAARAGDRRTRGRQELLVALACGATVEAAARKAGLSPRTAYRRLREPAFVKEVEALRAETARRAAAMLTAGALEAVKTLLVLLGEGQPPAVRLGAARAMLALGPKLREESELEGRLQALEAQLREGGRVR